MLAVLVNLCPEQRVSVMMVMGFGNGDPAGHQTSGQKGTQQNTAIEHEQAPVTKGPPTRDRDQCSITVDTFLVPSFIERSAGKINPTQSHRRYEPTAGTRQRRNPRVTSAWHWSDPMRRPGLWRGSAHHRLVTNNTGFSRGEMAPGQRREWPKWCGPRAPLLDRTL